MIKMTLKSFQHTYICSIKKCNNEIIVSEKTDDELTATKRKLGKETMFCLQCGQKQEFNLQKHGQTYVLDSDIKRQQRLNSNPPQAVLDPWM